MQSLLLRADRQHPGKEQTQWSTNPLMFPFITAVRQTASEFTYTKHTKKTFEIRNDNSFYFILKRCFEISTHQSLKVLSSPQIKSFKQTMTREFPWPLYFMPCLVPQRWPKPHASARARAHTHTLTQRHTHLHMHNQTKRKEVYFQQANDTFSVSTCQRGLLANVCYNWKLHLWFMNHLWLHCASAGSLHNRSVKPI